MMAAPLVLMSQYPGSTWLEGGYMLMAAMRRAFFSPRTLSGTLLPHSATKTAPSANAPTD